MVSSSTDVAGEINQKARFAIPLTVRVIVFCGIVVLATVSLDVFLTCMRKHAEPYQGLR